MKAIKCIYILSWALIFSSIISLSCNTGGDDDDVEIFAAFSAQGPDTSIPASEDGVTIRCGECVRFFDLSSLEVTAYFWDFEGGDPADSEEDGPVVCYKDPGKFDVALSVDAGADRIVKPDFICVLPKETSELTANFSIDVDEIIRNQIIKLTDLSTGSPDSWSWSIQNASIDTASIINSAVQNPEITLLLPGSYNISLTVNRGSESDTKVEENAIRVLDFTDFSCFLTGLTTDIGLTAQHTFNDENQITRLEERAGGDILGASDYSWNANGLLDRIDIFDNNLDFINRWTFNYNAQGILIQQTFFDENEQMLQSFDFNFENGRISGAFILNSDGQGGFTPARAQYFYDTDTSALNVIQERITSEDGQTLFSVNTYDFDDQISPYFELNIQPWPARSFFNNVTRFTTSDANGVIFIDRNSIYTYNEFGRAALEMRTSGSSTQQFFYEYNCEKKN